MFERIRELCEAKGLTVSELCEKAGIGQSTISNLKARGGALSVGTLQSIAKVLDCTIDDLVPSEE